MVVLMARIYGSFLIVTKKLLTLTASLPVEARGQLSKMSLMSCSCFSVMSIWSAGRSFGSS